MLIQYIRRVKNEISPAKKVPMKRTYKVGVLVAFLTNNDNITIGWSAVNTQSNDKFDRNEGLTLAKQNTYQIMSPDMVARMPHKIRVAMPDFIDRCERYFKRKVVR